MFRTRLIGCVLATVVWLTTASASYANPSSRTKIIDRPGSMQLLLDGQIVREALAIDNETLSPDGKRLAYSYARLVKVNGLDKAEHFLVIDGHEHGPYEQVGQVTFSRDSTQIATMVYTQQSPRHPRLQCIFLNSKVIASDAGANLIGFDAANRFYYRTYDRHAKNSFVRVIELNKAGEGEPRIMASAGWVIINADGQRVAVHEGRTVSALEINARLVIDGKPLPWFGGIDATQAMFSPDGRRVAYIAWNDAQTRMAVIDGEVVARCKGFAANPIWSDDGSAVAFIGYPTGRGTDKVEQLFINGKVVGEASRFDIVRFSPDGNHWAAVARDSISKTKHSFRVLENGREVGPYDRIDLKSFAINAQGTLTFTATKDGKAVSYRSP